MPVCQGQNRVRADVFLVSSSRSSFSRGEEIEIERLDHPAVRTRRLIESSPENHCSPLACSPQGHSSSFLLSPHFSGLPSPLSSHRECSGGTEAPCLPSHLCLSQVASSSASQAEKPASLQHSLVAVALTGWLVDAPCDGTGVLVGK